MKYLIATLALLCSVLPYKAYNGPRWETEKSTTFFGQHAQYLYGLINEPSLGFHIFQTALKGYYQMLGEGKLKNREVLTIADFSQSSNSKRLYVIDMIANKLIRKSWVAHGRGSGEEYATQFSNGVGSNMSSLGFYIANETYHGNHGLSIRLDGLESTNSNARNRAVVIHSADYVSQSFIDVNNRLGRSFGCPALPAEGYSQLVDLIKGGSCLFIYYPDAAYLKQSKYANATQFIDQYIARSL
ncbi:MAG: murein L,D-transpeptidase catalytic domain family protein [Chitinophagales bacterium]|nr:murein L,D-transpeptidase catalytic domain family protein [Chitinophagales bacterium]